MDTLTTFLIFAHVAGGIGTLILGPMAMVSRKGGKRHVDWGLLYYRLMIWVLFSAILRSITRRFVFFFVAVTVMASYSTFTGIRCLFQKGKVATNARGKAIDWVTSGIVFLFALVLSSTAR